MKNWVVLPQIQYMAQFSVGENMAQHQLVGKWHRHQLL